MTLHMETAIPIQVSFTISLCPPSTVTPSLHPTIPPGADEAADNPAAAAKPKHWIVLRENTRTFPARFPENKSTKLGACLKQL